MPDGKPAAGAKVLFFPVDFHPRANAKRAAADPDSTRADPSGNFAITLPEGQYNVLARLDSLQAFRDSVTLSGQGLELSTVTLKLPGSIRGRIVLQRNHDPRAAFVELIGSDFFSNVDDSGRFAFERVPEGAYTLACRTTLPDYIPSFRLLEVQSGAAADVPAPIELAFTGLPAVQGLRAEYDTASGVARISWDASAYFALKDYLLSRNAAGALSPAAAVAAVTDTFFNDTLYRDGWPAQFADRPDSLPLDLEYRVRVHSKSDSAGPFFETASLRAVPPGWVATQIALRVLGGKGDSGRAGDTIRIAGSFRNRTRQLASLAWSLDPSAAPLRVRDLGAESGEDTLPVVLDKPSRPWIKLTVRDAAGSARTESLQVDIVLDAPRASAGGDSVVPVRGTLRLKAGATARFGSIAKWEWDIGNTGTFREGRDTLATAPTSPDTNYLCILRVTADNGLTASDTLRVRVMPWARLADAPCKGIQPFGYTRVGPSRAVLNGKLYSLCADDPYLPTKIQMQVFDPVTSTWTAKATAPNPGEGARLYAMHAIGNILYLPNPENLLAYDPALDKWSIKAKPPTIRTYSGQIGIPGIAVGGKLYLVGGNAYGGREGNPTTKVDIYDPATDSWKSGGPVPLTASNAGPDWGGYYNLAAAGDRLVLYYNTLRFDNQIPPTRRTFSYNTASDAWEKIDSSSTRSGVLPPFATLSGRIYIDREPDAFDVATMKWVPSGFPEGGLEYPSDMAAVGDRIVSIRAEGIAPDPITRPHAPFTTFMRSWQVPSGAWQSHIPLVADVEWAYMEAIGDRLFLFTGDMDAPMQTFEYYLP